MTTPRWLRHPSFGAGTLAMCIGTAMAGSAGAEADSDVGTPASSSSTTASSSAPASRGRTVQHPAARTRLSSSAALQTSRFGIPRRTRLAKDPAPATYTVANPLPPRLQWLANNGYCGEESFVGAGLYYGQYISQYDARALASNNAPQNTERSQLLLGVNDVAAAKAMHLTATPFDTAAQNDTTSFLTWVRSNVAAGYPVAIGLYTNEFRFYGRINPNAGDPQYDHIATVTGITSTSPLGGPVAYSRDDVITFSDHGLWTGTPTGLPQNLFSYAFGAFPATRRRANAPCAPVYSLPDTGENYGIAITGVADQNHETVPVRLTTNVNAENPPMVDGSTARPPAAPVTLTVTMSNLTPGTTYNLYRYSSMATVPDGGFNANASRAAARWTIVATAPTYTTTETIMSNDVAVYRAVPTSAG